MASALRQSLKMSKMFSMPCGLLTWIATMSHVSGMWICDQLFVLIEVLTRMTALEGQESER